MALTQVHVLQVYHTRFCVYSPQNELLLAKTLMYAQQLYSRQQRVKRYSKRWIPQAQYLWQG